MKTTISRTIICAALLIATAATARAADWNLPVTIASGATRTGVVIGLSGSATNGYDAGLDAQNPFTDELISAYFSHPEWNLVKSGKPVSSFYRDVRGAIPQSFVLTVKTALMPLTISWEDHIIPATLGATISDGSISADMHKVTSFTYNPAGQTTTLTISITNGDITPPAAPVNLGFTAKDSAIYLFWDANAEADLGGYRLHFAGANGEPERTLDLKKATNYNMLNVKADIPYTIGVSAYDTTGNNSEQSAFITAMLVSPVPIIKPTGDYNGDGMVNKTDVQQMLRFVRTSPENVSAELLARVDMDGDGKLTSNDVGMIDALLPKPKSKRER